MSENYHFIIGIDPDLHKNGVAVFDCFEKKLTICKSLHLWDLMFILSDYHNNSITKIKESVLILLEYPKNTNTYHSGGKGAALNVGKNQAVAIILKEFLETYKFGYKLLYPNGYSDYFNDIEKFKKITKFEERTNSDARAAAAMIYKNCYHLIK